MKTCPYCGKQYPDEAIRCLIDGELLVGGESGQIQPHADIAAGAVPPPPPASVSTEPSPTPPGTWTDRQTRIIEVALVCVIAFGGSILSSAHHLSNGDSVASDSGTALAGSMIGPWSWASNILREGASLCLLWYVLMRRSRTFSDLGLSWVKKDFGQSIFLFIIGNVAAFAVYRAIALGGLTAAEHATAVDHVGHYLFGGGITFGLMLFQFLNPFCEELIVRGYVMTELKQLTNSVSKPVLFSTLLQTSYHFYQGVPLALSYAATFLVFSVYYSKTNRLAPIILAHLYCDVGSTLLYILHHL